MKRLALFLGLAASFAFGCGGDDSGDDDDTGPDATAGQPDAAGGGGNPGFTTPTEVTTAYDSVGGVWTEVGPANWDCLNTASTDVASTVEITLTGTVNDFQEGDPRDGAEVTVYGDVDFSGNGLDMTTSDAEGAYSVTMPAGQKRVAFKISKPTEALDTYQLNQYFTPDMPNQNHNLDSVSILTANALPAFIGVTRTQGLGVLAGAIRDCDGNEVANAIATVSSTSGEVDHLEGAETYYFSAGSTSLPVRHTQRASTNKDSLFVVIELPVTNTSYLQVWGFTSDQDPATDELTLLSEIPSPVLPDSVITASLEALRTE